MTQLVVETGSIVTGANGYVTMEVCVAYCATRGLTFVDSPSTAGEQAIIRATAYIDGKYRAKFPGYRTSGRTQSLEWPRTAAYDYEGIVIATTDIPIELKNAVCEAAVRELATPGTMAPDLDRGGDIRSVRAGSVSIDFGPQATVETHWTVISQILSSLLGPVQSTYSSPSSRG